MRYATKFTQHNSNCSPPSAYRVQHL